ncbi:MAG: cytochrome oxidase [Verrucomicrobiaceae bacterium]|nr:cytochrome oxidase [Verrucomicrobiaceae bacterium]
MPPSDLNTTSLGSICDDGSKKILHPADVSGKYTTWRRRVAGLLLLVYVALPWIPVNGFPAVFLDVQERRFHFFGLTLATQDLWVFFFLISGLGFSLFFVTSLLGRVWCGWTCPYTVFLEHLFRRVERMVDGDAHARRHLDAAPWDVGKIVKRVVKHTLYILMSAAIAHVFLSYFVSIKGLYSMMQRSPQAHATVFGVVIFLTASLYFCFSWFREQFCVIMCPYGRMQSALVDDHSINIGYDKLRGEPRGKATDPNAGSCINCNRCVQVCPTGIDIRNGLQLECIGCAACVDACDDIMIKVDRKPGLIRYDSEAGFSGGKTKLFRARTLFYTVLTVIGASVFAYRASHIEPMFANATRMSGGSAFNLFNGSSRNQFMVRVINKRNQPSSYKVSVEGDVPRELQIAGNETLIQLAGQGEDLKSLVFTLPQAAYSRPLKMVIRITEVSTGNSLTTMPMEFVGPDPRSQNHDYLNASQYLQK